MKQPSIFLVALAALICSAATANDSTFVQLNNKEFKKKDTIDFSCFVSARDMKGVAGLTLNLWIQNLETKAVTRFRYPVLQGEAHGSLVIGDSIPEGYYAFNFVLQKGLYSIFGNSGNNSLSGALSYFMFLKNGQRVANVTELSKAGTFLIKNLVFEDEATILLNPTLASKHAGIDINIVTPLDSAFTPVKVITHIVSVGKENKPAPRYTFDFDNTFTGTMPNVTVTHRKEKKIDEFNRKYSMGLFQGDAARIFDGLEDDAISRSMDIESFLESQVPGLSVMRSTDGGSSYMAWRGEPVVVYVDEMQLDDCEAITVTPGDVAMIKVYQPPAQINSGLPRSAVQAPGCPLKPEQRSFSGAVAIYTKRGPTGKGKNQRQFRLTGYTRMETVWR